MTVIGATFGRFPAFGKTLPESDPIWRMESTAIRRGTAPLCCRNLLLTIDVRPFLSIAADTPATGNNDVGRETRSNRQTGPVVQASPDDYFVWRHDAVRQNREKPL
ncbi:hypothetical protein EOC93_27525 [Mesorhizobium sp. M6A.T.Ce.TU.002.03.1.1]|uniref:hypothetical protein n=1 Tax=Mesorhizobium sp. M6A.T.Ce.TU.002.03.1.1 TaxID=2496782 RepID=UPI000FCAF1EB|nr:hypothetical protein [Mesorhizobium sp. M6A.T.Ce.TU.002.03.1.1]RUU34093.1 hypothetical protein EOC93_27525 [Mesorhizobium sp. M6A.T.Ce.TU.002.03.1.1]